jgi:Carboxypeptidase regulatory-like domain
LFEWSSLRVRRFLPFGLISFALLLSLAASLRAQETSENPAAGTIQGTVRDEDGVPVDAARISYSSQATETKGVTRAGKDGVYASEPMPPGVYVVRVDGRDMLASEATVTVTAGAAATADFKLDWINPGPARPEARLGGDTADRLPINGRNYLAAGELEAGVQPMDGAILQPGKSGFQSLSILSVPGRTTHFDIDEIEAMDETSGLVTVNLPALSVNELTVSLATPELFQSLNAAGAVRITTRSGGDEWHGNFVGLFRDRAVGLAGFPGTPSYSRQQYGFGVGGAVIRDKAFVYFGGERTKQNGMLPTELAFPVNGIGLRDSPFRQNMLTGRLDYNLSDNMKFFVRLGYDNANMDEPANSQSTFRNHLNVPSAAFGLDWSRGRFLNSARFGYQKMISSINPDPADSLVYAAAPFHIQLGSYSLGPSIAGPRQTIQRDLYGRYDSSATFHSVHTLRFGGAIHRIAQGDYFAPGNFGPSVTSSNGLATIGAINSNPSLFPIIPGDPRGAADYALNYPVGTVTIFNGLGNFSENSGFNRSAGAHYDTRFEGYVGDTINVIPSLNFTVGVNYVLDTRRTDSDLAATPCSAINPGIVTSPPCTGSSLILDQFGFLPPVGNTVHQSLGQSISRPYKNFAPQAALAWDPGHSGRTVIRASGGLFYDNFLLQNTYQDRINRLSNGQYNRSLTLCPTGAYLRPDAAAIGFPNDVVTSSLGLDIATQICGQPLVAQPLGPSGPTVAQAIQDLQTQFISQQNAASGANVYSLANSLANFGGLLAPGFKTPRVAHISVGLEHQMGERSMFSIDYVREIGTQFPLGIDTNHVGDASYLTDGSNPNVQLNTFAAELSAISATVATAGCGPALFTGGSSQAAVDCYLSRVPTASITDFARQGLDSSNAFCGPFPCSVLGKQQAAFGGINPTVGSNIMYFPTGRSKYEGIHLNFRTSSAANPFRRVQKIDLAISYTLSRYRSNIAAPDGSGGDYSTLNVAEDYNRPHLGHFGAAGLDRRHQLVFAPTVQLPHGPRLSLIALLGSPLPLSVRIPQQNGGGVAGEIFRSDLSGDGKVGDLLTGTLIGSTGKYSPEKLNTAIAFYNKNVAGQLTAAGRVLVGTGLLRTDQMIALGAYAPLISSCYPANPGCGLPGRPAEATWLKTVDLRLSWPFSLGEHVKIEPMFSAFNILNFANFGGPGGQLSGILDGSPGASLNNATSSGVCGGSTTFCTSRLDRILPGSGTYGNGAPRQMEFGVRIRF